MQNSPRASGGWGLCPQTPRLRRLGASPPDPHWPPVAEGSTPRPPKQPPPPIANLWLHACPQYPEKYPKTTFFLTRQRSTRRTNLCKAVSVETSAQN